MLGGVVSDIVLTDHRLFLSDAFFGAPAASALHHGPDTAANRQQHHQGNRTSHEDLLFVTLFLYRQCFVDRYRLLCCFFQLRCRQAVCQK